MNALRSRPESSEAAIFTGLARRVRRRLIRAEWRRALTALAWVPWVGVAAVVALRLAGAAGWDLAAAVASVAGWLGAAAARAWTRRPSLYAALSNWDTLTGRNELFSSALAFAQTPAPDAGRELHLIRARIELDEIISRLPRELPLPRLRWPLVLGPVVAVTLAVLPWGRPVPTLGDQPLTEEMLAAAQAEAEALAAADPLAAKNAEALSDEERRLLEELQRQQQELAEKLKNAAGQTPRELLDALEKQARAAEELARQLGAGKEAWASEAMLQEMKQHPDTAELAEALEDKNAGQASEEARELADKLRSPELTQEATERLKTAFDRTMQKASETDRAQPTGQHVGAAAEDLQQENPAAAGAEMQALADKFARQQQRENAQAELDKLAEQLRQSGNSLMGQQGEGLQKLAGASGDAAESSPMPDLMPLSEMAADASAMDALPMTDLPVQPGTPRGTPIPGAGPPPKDAKPLAVVPGTAPAGGPPLAVAKPIPGAGGAAIPIPGAGSSSAPSGQPGAGGLLAGRGAAELNGKATTPQAAAAQGEVTVAAGEGESFLQTVQGQPRQEDVQRATRATAADFLKTQENAFDEKNLPPARRQQVKRYFDSLRQRFGE